METVKINAIVLAAGFGSRLAPLTEIHPKPVLPIAGTPMLARILRRLKNAGVGRIAVNTHHLREQVADCVAESEYADSVTLFDEPEILGTGGPLVNAKELLADCDAFLLHNCDAVNDFDLKRMFREHFESGADVTMAMVDGPENRVFVKDGAIRAIGNRPEGNTDGMTPMTYACVSLHSPRFFEFLPDRPCNCSIVDAWVKAIEAGCKIRAFFPDSGYLWCDIGSFRQYFDVHARLLGHTVHAEPGARIAPDAQFGGFVSIGRNAEIEAGAHLENCIVLDNAAVRGVHRWEVLTEHGAVHRETRFVSQLPFIKNLPHDWSVGSLEEQGSDRRFLRFRRTGEPSKILMISSAKDADFGRFVQLGRFFSRHNLFTPEIYESDPATFTVLMEDLGDRTIWRIAHGRETENPDLYRRIVRALAEFQVRGTAALDADAQEIRVFARPLLLWETSYCRENFFRRLCGFEFSGTENAELDRELLLLAQENERAPHLLIHRDFQSQNILEHNSRIRFVDYQGARLAPYAYDLAALLKDPYMNIPAAMRDTLCEEYRAALADLDYPLNAEEFRRHYALASLQRGMQALGAYGFLSLTKGKMKYLDYAAPCLELLADGLENSPFVFTLLKELCAKAREVLPERIKHFRESK